MGMIWGYEWYYNGMLNELCPKKKKKNKKERNEKKKKNIKL